MLYLIAYDISVDARRTKLAELLEGFGQRVQRSVFECDLNEDEYRALERKMKRILKLEEGDDVPGAAGQGRAADGVACAIRRARSVAHRAERPRAGHMPRYRIRKP